MSSEYKKTFLSAAVKTITAALIGALLSWAAAIWFSNDLEYKVISKDGYLTAALGQQGLTLAYQSKPIKNVSIVEFGIFNRTSHQFDDVDLEFLIQSEDGPPPELVSGGVIAPKGLPQADIIEERVSKEPNSKRFHIKAIPKRQDKEFFYSVFVFKGDKAPKISVVSLSKGTSISPYQQWKDDSLVIVTIIGICVLGTVLGLVIASFLDHFWEPRNHAKRVTRFLKFANDLSNDSEEKYSDSEIETARKIFSKYSRPQTTTFWSKIFGPQAFID